MLIEQRIDLVPKKSFPWSIMFLINKAAKREQYRTLNAFDNASLEFSRLFKLSTFQALKIQI